MEDTMEDHHQCASFSSRVFYPETWPSTCGRKMEDKLFNVARGVRHLEQHPPLSVYRPGILGPPATWRIFTRQAEAIRYTQVQGEGLMVFAFEGDAIGAGGRRNFLVTHPAQMWLRQSERHPDRRCAYEVIQEKSVCKLYFDLEFLYACNPERVGVMMTDTLIDIVCFFLGKEFNILCSRKDVIDLSGTSCLKFSRHLIFNLPNVAFANNVKVGNFVKMVCNKIRMWRDGREAIDVPGVTPQRVKDLFVFDSKSTEVLFCDEGVYTKNRNFRLFLSTKYGHNSPLIIAKENQYVPNCTSGKCKDEQIFYDSLITLVDSSCTVLNFEEGGESVTASEKLCTNGKKLPGSAMEGLSHSPYPEIDEFIRGVIGAGRIHSWHYFSQQEVLLYNIAHNRFCHNIGRDHKSNGIMFVVNLKTASYYQKCHDPDCKGFRSESWPLPKSTVFWQYMTEGEMMDWIHSVDENDDNNKDWSLATAMTQVEAVSEEQDTDALELWGKVDQMFSSFSSTQSSQKGSQSSQASSNPWDKLSLLSSPSSSLLDELSQRSSTDTHLPLTLSGNLETNASQVSETRDRYTHEIECDEDFLRAVCTIEEQLLLANNEMEIVC